MQLHSRLRLGTTWLAISLAAISLGGCTTVEKGWNSTKNAVTGLFSDDDEKAPPPDQTAEAEPADAAPATSAPMTGGLFMGSQSATSAFQTSAPEAAAEPAKAPEPMAEPEAPKAAKETAPPKPAPEPKKPKSIEGLVADTDKAAYTETAGRRAPVTVRPLNENAAVADAAPPRPAAAPVEQVARLQGELEPPAASAQASAAPPAPEASSEAPSAAELADRLSAPAPTPSPSLPDEPVRAPEPMIQTPAPSQVAAVPTPTQIQPLVAPAPSQSIVNYDQDTVVVDSDGVKGGRNVLGTPAPGSIRAGFDPGNASVSSEVGTIMFSPGSSAIPAQGKTILADVVRLRAQVDGAIRVVGRGSQAATRAATVSRELRRLGVPASRLYDGGADSAMLGDAADIYLDY